MPLYPNQILRQRYQIHALLGQGGFGAVYKALDLNLNRWCAVKENLLDPSLTPAQQQAQQQQFQREAMMLSRLRHQSLPQIHDYFIEPSGQQYLVMEFVEGTDLHALVQQRGALQEAQAVGWITQILDALEYLHTQQPPIIHRDIKPQNIIITSQGRAMLVDFGIAKVMMTGRMTMSGARGFGSSGFAPPEQYRGGTDQRSDIYSLGATLYSLLTRHEPPDALSLASRTAILAPPRSLNSAVNVQTEQVIMRAMEAQPEKRFQQACEMRTALNLNQLHIDQPSASVIMAKRRFVVVFSLVLLFGIVLGFSSGWFVGVMSVHWQPSSDDVAAIADSYALNNDLALAKARLQGVSKDRLSRILTYLVQDANARNRPLEAERYAALAQALSVLIGPAAAVTPGHGQ